MSKRCTCILKCVHALMRQVYAMFQIQIYRSVWDSSTRYYMLELLLHASLYTRCDIDNNFIECFYTAGRKSIRYIYFYKVISIDLSMHEFQSCAFLEQSGYYRRRVNPSMNNQGFVEMRESDGSDSNIVGILNLFIFRLNMLLWCKQPFLIAMLIAIKVGRHLVK